MSASLKQIDVHGMLPRTHIFATNHKDGNIVIIIPLHYLRGLSDRCSSNMKISMSYEIMNVKEHLNNNKDHPLSYETYIAYRIGT